MAFTLPVSFFAFSIYRHYRTASLEIDNFFPLHRVLNIRQYASTTIATGLSLSTVFIAVLDLSPVFKIYLIFAAITYALGLFLLYILADRILARNPDNLTLPGFLGDKYTDKSLSFISGLFVLIGYMSIFGLEVLVGTKILGVYFPGFGQSIGFFYVIFMIGYTAFNGYNAIIATDKIQLLLVSLSVGALVTYSFYMLSHDKSSVDTTELLSIDFEAFIAFIVGISVINIFGAICDTGTWQRLCSVEKTNIAKRSLIVSFIAAFVLWMALIFIGIVASTVIPATDYQVASSISNKLLLYLAEHDPLRNLVLMLFLMGLFSAMISTADSILLVATQIFSFNILWEKRKLRLSKVRFVVITIGFFSYVIFLAFSYYGIDVVEAVFAIFGAHLSLLPSVLYALFNKDQEIGSLLGRFATVSIILGYLASWSMVLIPNQIQAMSVLYSSPIVALSVSMVIFLVGVAYAKWKKHNKFSHK
ncbi:MAG: hypothetical protein JAZ17_05605 [Candidatus Thiodiazotropha endolucinida]|nr:hypothetical protein [Candidatus Thiodiazotropha endolucinida]